jgi:hypothetical protein
MKNYLLPLLILPLLIMSCQKEDDILTPIPQNIETVNNIDTTTVNNIDTTTVNNIDTTTVNNIDTTTVSNTDTTTNNTTTSQPNYKLVKCTYEYIDNNDPSNNINYVGYPYSEYGITADFSNGEFNIDTILVNMPMYPSHYTLNATLPLYLPNGQPEWYQITVNSTFKTEEYVEFNADMKRVICSQTLYGLNFRLFITEDNGTITLHLPDLGDNWRSNQTLCFEPM